VRYPENVVGPDTELVIDGFMRTASTFAVVAFQISQPRPVRLAHHLHAPAQVLEAVRRRIPVLVTVREPEDAVISTAIWEPHVGVHAALAAYVRFYSALLTSRSALVVGDYRRVTSDYASVIAEVNDRFGTSFALFDGTEAATAECFAIIEDRSRRPTWDGAIGRFMSGLGSKEELDAARAADSANEPVPDSRVARPAAAREARKEALRAHYASPRLARLREQAESVHAAFSELR
jgi:hypothetical protein